MDELKLQMSIYRPTLHYWIGLLFSTINTKRYIKFCHFKYKKIVIGTKSAIDLDSFQK